VSGICNKCKNLWQRLGKNYCIKGACGGKCKYSKTKKQCDSFEKGENIKKYLGGSNGWWKKQN
jgi:hypothetical protein